MFEMDAIEDFIPVSRTYVGCFNPLVGTLSCLLSSPAMVMVTRPVFNGTIIKLGLYPPVVVMGRKFHEYANKVSFDARRHMKKYGLQVASKPLFPVN